MRDIKFRAWNKSAKYMIPWKDYYYSEIHELFDTTTIELMQYTGLKDSKGTDIYEGDIVKYKVSNQILDNSTRDESEVVKWENVGWNLNVFQEYEIIGNLYENPELI